LLTSTVKGGDQFKSLTEACSSDLVVRERVSTIHFGRMADTPVANRADILQLSIRYDTLAGVTKRFLKVTDGVLLKYEGLQHSVERKEMSSTSNLTFKASECLDRGFSLTQSFQRGTQLVVPRQLFA
jgi:hypothetical protein